MAIIAKHFSARKLQVCNAPDTPAGQAWRMRRDVALAAARLEQLAKFPHFTAENFADAIEFAEIRYRELMAEA